MLQEEAALAETNAAAYAEKSRLLEESVNAARDQRGRKSEEIEKSMRAANDALASVNEKLRDLQQKVERMGLASAGELTRYAPISAIGRSLRSLSSPSRPMV